MPGTQHEWQWWENEAESPRASDTYRDIAYNMDDANGTVADDFLNDIEPIASRIPYMTTPGNHETDESYSYKTCMPSLLRRTIFRRRKN